MGAARQRVGAQILELAHFVAAQCKPGRVIALNEKPTRRKAECVGQPVEGLHRGRQMRESHPAETEVALIEFG